MLHPGIRLTLARAHFWLSLAVGAQMLIWIGTGLFFALTPIQKVRGEHLRQTVEPAPIIWTDRMIWPEQAAAVADCAQVAELAVRMVAGRATYLVSCPGVRRLVDAETGVARAELSEAEARSIALATYAGAGRLDRLERLDEGPHEFGRPGPVWVAHFGGQDPARLYVEAQTGQARVIRTGLWTVYDVLWGFHIMDWKGRENFNHPLLIGFALAALGMAGTGVALTADRALRLRRS